MTTGFDRRTNLFEQFAGFFKLEEVDLQAYRTLPAPIDLTLGRERTQKSKIVKQADVIALHVEIGRALRHRHPGLLVQILGGVGLGGAQHAADELETWAVVPVVKPRESLRVARDVGSQQVGVVRGVRLHRRPV